MTRSQMAFAWANVAGRERELGPTVVIAIGTGRTIQDRAHDFQTAVDRGRTRAVGEAPLHEGLQRLIVNLFRFKISEVWLEQCDVSLDCFFQIADRQNKMKRLAGKQHSSIGSAARARIASPGCYTRTAWDQRVPKLKHAAPTRFH